jgi:PKD repeat protein
MNKLFAVAVICLACCISSLSLISQNIVTLELTTDCWGGEVSWSIEDGNGVVIASQPTNFYGNDQIFTEVIDLPDGCYTFFINDSYGDGMYGSQWGGCAVDGNYVITDANADILVQMTAPNANYGTGTSHQFSVPTPGSILGCTDPSALNYNACASLDDGSCTYPPIVAAFSFDTGSSCAGAMVQFTDGSTGDPVSWAWDFPGGTPATSTDQNPIVDYAASGTFSATLTVTNQFGNTDQVSYDIIINAGITLDIVIVQDNYPGETSWDVQDELGNVLATGGVAGGSVCLADECHSFTIYDSYGDGICCGYGQGSYTLFINGLEVGTGGEFAFSQSVNVNCPPGTDCNNAIVVGEGEHTAPYDNAWFNFTPAANGQYRITTCDRATCDTKIWMYDYCNMGLFDDTNEATLTYNDDLCGVQAEITPLLAGGQTYWIRIGSTDGSCTGTVDFAIEYMGPIQGCTDPLACNYLPIAEIPDVCYFPGDIQCPGIGPDLFILEDVFYNSMYNTTLTSNDACYIAEGCMQGFGERQIIRFTTHIKNIGTEDYFIGDPNDNPDQFEFDACHNHWHYEGYAEYVMYDDFGAPMPQIGFKNGFCVLDLECSDGGQAKYTCGNMGITAGCGDIYSSGLSCQWVDVTDVAPGSYTLVMRTNWDQSPDANGSYELSYENNWAAVCFSFDRDANGNMINFTKSLDCPVIFDCAGIPFGIAVPDCANNCPGIVAKGDVNNSGELDTADANQYASDILGTDYVITPCTDMNNDGTITVTDAALIAGCVFYGPDHVDELGVLDHCIWDDEIINPNHTTTLSIGEINTDLGYLDIHVLNPDNEIVGYEFNLSGLTILSVENLADPLVYDITPQASLGGNKVLGFTYDDMIFQKNTSPVPIVRVYYQTITSPDICISQIVDIVNENYHNVLTVAGPCMSVGIADFADFGVSANVICQGESVNFTDLSSMTIVSWDWNFTGASPASSTDQNPTNITYNTPGVYSVTLTANNGIQSDSETKAALITVLAHTHWHLDFDNDGYGDGNTALMACDAPVGYVTDNSDCDDLDLTVYPGAPGTGLNIDNDCNGIVEGTEIGECIGDFNQDGNRDVADLLYMLQYFGCNLDCGEADLNGDGNVTQADLLSFLPMFGIPCD